MTAAGHHDDPFSPRRFLSFYCAGAVLVGYSAILLYLSVRSWAVPGLQDGLPSIAALALATASLIASLAFVVWPIQLRIKAAVLYDFPAAVQQVNARVADLEAVRREHYKARSAVESLHQSVQQEAQSLAEIVDSLRAAVLDRKRIEDELTNERRDKVAAQNQATAWRDAWIDMFRLLERLLSHQELTGPYRDAVEKVLVDFSRTAAPLGLERISPRPGDPFDDRVHQAIGEAESADVPPGHILECREWGYRDGSQRIAYARVVLARSPVDVADGSAGVASQAGEAGVDGAQAAEEATRAAEAVQAAEAVHAAEAAEAPECEAPALGPGPAPAPTSSEATDHQVESDASRAEAPCTDAPLETNKAK